MAPKPKISGLVGGALDRRVKAKAPAKKAPAKAPAKAPPKAPVKAPAKGKNDLVYRDKDLHLQGLRLGLLLTIVIQVLIIILH
jgi:hypothetical protein